MKNMDDSKLSLGFYLVSFFLSFHFIFKLPILLSISYLSIRLFLSIFLSTLNFLSICLIIYVKLSILLSIYSFLYFYLFIYFKFSIYPSWSIYLLYINFTCPSVYLFVCLYQNGWTDRALNLLITQMVWNFIDIANRLVLIRRIKHCTLKILRNA